MKHNKINLYLNYIYEFFLSLKITHIIWPTFLVFRGYSLVQVGLCESVFHLTSMLAEMPTGIISDLYGRRFSRLLGRIADIVSILLLIFSSHIGTIYFSFMLTAIAYNLESGTDTAYVYDLLLETKEEDTFPHVQGLREIIVQSGLLIGIVLGGILTRKSYEFAYALSLFIVVLSIIILLMMKEIKNIDYQKTNVLNDVKQQFKSAYKVIKDDKNIFYLLLCHSLFAASVTTIQYFVTNAWTIKGLEFSTISFYLAMMNVAGIVAGLIFPQIIQKFTQKQLLILLPLFIVIAMFGIPFYPLSIICIVFMGFIETGLYVVILFFLNKLIKSSVRATVLSAQSMLFSIIMIAYFPLVGLFGDLIGLELSFLILAIVNVMVFFIFRRSIQNNYKE